MLQAKCTVCNGEGRVVRIQRGSGRPYLDPCELCQGTGHIEVSGDGCTAVAANGHVSLAGGVVLPAATQRSTR